MESSAKGTQEAITGRVKAREATMVFTLSCFSTIQGFLVASLMAALGLQCDVSGICKDKNASRQSDKAFRIA
jgi:hypothetical protein